MSMDQLLKYEGRNPRPADFDAYWEAGLAEMNATDPKPELIANPLKSSIADCFNLYFTGVGGARIHAKYLRPKQSKGKRPAVLQFHGYTGNSGDWQEKLAYVSQGFSVAALDCRGQGGLSEDLSFVKGNTHKGHIIRGLDDAPEKLYYRQMYLDTAMLARVVMAMPEVDPDRVGATGGSQGGGLTLACASLVPRIKLAAPVFPFLCDYKRVWEMDLAVGAYEELRAYFRHFDPHHERENAIFERLGYIDNQFLTPRIQAEVLMPFGMMDTICPPSTQFAAYNRITSKKSLLVYPDFGHEGLPGCSDKIFDFLAEL